MRVLVAFLLTLPLALALTPSAAASCGSEWTTATHEGHYVRTYRGPGYTDVDIGGAGVEDRLVAFSDGVHVEVYRESNGDGGLQTQCGESDERVAKLYVGAGRASITL